MSEELKETVETTVSKKKNNLPIIIGATVFVIVAIVFAIIAILFATGKLGSGKRDNPNFDDKYLEDPSYDTTTLGMTELLDIAAKALDEGDYAKAIENYEKALEIDEMSVDAYLGLVEAYIRSGDFEKALEIAKKGYEKTGDQRLQEKIDMIESGNIVDSRGLFYKKTMYDAGNQVVYWQVFSYDENGEVASVTSYDANGNQTGHVDCDHSNPLREVNYCTYTDSGKVFMSVTEYDESGRMIKSTYYGGETESDAWYMTYEYEGDKNIETQYGIDGTVQCRYIHYQEGNKHVTENYHYESYNDTFVLDSKQVDDGNRTYYYDADGSMTYYTEMQYDEDGNVTGYAEYNPDGSLIRYEVYE